MLLLLLLVIYTFRNMAVFSSYGFINTISYSANRSWVWINENIKELHSRKETESPAEDASLQEIISEPSIIIPPLYSASMTKEGASSYSLSDFNQSLASLDDYQFWSSGYSANNFIIQADVACSSSTRSANWDQSGCGFVFGLQDNNNYHAAYLALDGYVRMHRLEDGERYDLQGGYYDRLDTPEGRATYAVEKLNSELIAYVNNQQVVRIEDPKIKSGDIGYAVFSSTNQPEGIRCYMKSVTLWTIP